MDNMDTILIKIGHSYRQGMTAEELYSATSISWKIAENKLQSGEYKYYCSVYNNKIKEIYELVGFEKDRKPENAGRFILKGRIADQSIRKKLIGFDVSDFHKGLGNPIKYANMEKLLSVADFGDDDNDNNVELNLTIGEIITHIDKYIASEGFYYEKQDITNLFLSLRSKPFVIISGISGTGKTMLIKWFAESLGANKENGQFTLIPVRPDWSDGSDLLGYKDIKGDYIPGPLTKVLKKANENPDKPYFVLLDEMNLARVEHYFSDFLSVIESREWQNNKLVSHSVLPKEIIGESIGVPDNFYILGTVNMDETTFPFSKKVLDRANTIEFNRVELNNFTFLENDVKMEPLVINNSKIKGTFLHLKDAYQENLELVHVVSKELLKINTLLEKMGAQVGYRVRDEICFYMIYNQESNLMNFNEAFDYQILQKILPRITGSDNRVFIVLKELYTYCTGIKINEENLDGLDRGIDEAKYIKSTRKLVEMIRRYNEGEFTSFWLGG
jgi:hypothetical protein